MSRLINIDPQIQQDSEPEGYEFGYYTFDTFPAIEVANIETTKEIPNKKEENNIDSIIKLPLTNEMLPNLQLQDTFCSHILTQIEKGNIKEGQTYLVQDKILKRYVIDGNNTYETVILPRALTAQVLRMAYDDLGHNGINEVLQAFIDNVYSKFGGSLKILSDNGTEFKNKIFEQVAKELGVVYKLYTPSYHPASNGKIEGFHAFLKACISKHVSPQLEWDDLVPLACAAYNFMPNEHSKESPFFLMFGRDPVLPLNTLLEPKIRYMGNDINIISLETMKNLYEIVATNLKIA